MNIIHSICKKVIKITDEDFESAITDARDQSEYVHPLKMAKAARIRKCGDNNLKIISNLKKLKLSIEGGKTE